MRKIAKKILAVNLLLASLGNFNITTAFFESMSEDFSVSKNTTSNYYLVDNAAIRGLIENRLILSKPEMVRYFFSENDFYPYISGIDCSSVENLETLYVPRKIGTLQGKITKNTWLALNCNLKSVYLPEECYSDEEKDEVIDIFESIEIDVIFYDKY